MNPLLEPSKLPFEAIDFNAIKTENFLPSLELAIKESLAKTEEIKKIKEPNFRNTIVDLGETSDKLDQVVNIFFALYSAHCTDELSAIAEEFEGMLTKYNSDRFLDEKLFKQIEKVYTERDKLNLNKEDQMLLKECYLGFTRNGALLEESDKKRLREIDLKLSKLNLSFSENLRNATNAYTLFIDNEEDLKGMPEGIIEAAKETAVNKNQPEKSKK